MEHHEKSRKCLYIRRFGIFYFPVFGVEKWKIQIGKTISILFIDIIRSIDLPQPEWYNHLVISVRLRM